MGIMLRDILDDNVDKKYYLSEKAIEYINRDSNRVDLDNLTIIAQRGRKDENGTYIQEIEPRFDGKTNIITSVQKDNLVHGCLKFGRTEEAKQIRKEHMSKGKDYTPHAKKEITGLDFEKMNTLTTNTNKDNLLLVHNLMPRSSKSGKGGIGPLSRSDGKTYCLDTGRTNAIEVIQINPSTESGWSYNNKRLNETLSKNKLHENCLIDSYNQAIHTDKSITISTRVSESNMTHIFKNSNIRKLTPTECEKLQTVPLNYTNHVSESQRYRMLGNGWTISVIVHILSYFKPHD